MKKLLLLSGLISILFVSCKQSHCVLPKENIAAYVNFIKQNNTSKKN